MVQEGDIDSLAEASTEEAPIQPSESLQADVWTSPPCINLQLQGDPLELIMAPGDVLVLRSSGRLSEIGNVGDLLDHVLVVLAPPICVHRFSIEAGQLRAAWPADAGVLEMWRVRTIDCSQQVPGLHETESLLYVERGSGRLMLVGEITCESNLILNEVEAVELWQSPRKLRESLRFDLMQEVAADMREHKGLDWSSLTVARAVVKSANAVAKPTNEQTMAKIMEYWTKAPICTSVVITFWQRYLVKLSGTCAFNVEPADLVMKWMPLKADRVRPGDLMNTLRSAGWVSMSQIPRIFRPMMCHAPPPSQQVPLARSTFSPRKSSAKKEISSGQYSDDIIMLESRAVTLTC